MPSNYGNHILLECVNLNRTRRRMRRKENWPGRLSQVDQANRLWCQPTIKTRRKQMLLGVHVWSLHGLLILLYTRSNNMRKPTQISLHKLSSFGWFALITYISTSGRNHLLIPRTSSYTQRTILGAHFMDKYMKMWQFIVILLWIY